MAQVAISALTSDWPGGRCRGKDREVVRRKELWPRAAAFITMTKLSKLFQTENCEEAVEPAGLTSRQLGLRELRQDPNLANRSGTHLSRNNLSMINNQSF